MDDEELTGICDGCGSDDKPTSWFEGWRGKRELCEECEATASMEE
jgi:hypothetical protein